MLSRKNVQNAHISSAAIRELHEALLDLMRLMNQPQRDEDLLSAAGLSLDRALFPLLVGIERRGPIGIVDLAEGVGRDYTTVSRQVAKLESLGLVERRQSAADRRVNEALITDQGKAMSARLDAAREANIRARLADWPEADLAELTRLMRKLTVSAQASPAE